MKNKVKLSRYALIILCFVIGLSCYYQMNRSYDPLARYQYTTDENRDIILMYLDDDDIDYMISQQLQPEQFMDFIKVDGFDIHNTVYYYRAKQTQEETSEYIVNFVNKYKEYFSKDSIQDLLSNYSYMDLTTFYENELTISNQLHLVSTPDEMYTILDSTHSIYKYVPDDISSYGTIEIQEGVISDLDQMLDAYYTDFGVSLNLVSGYLSYEDYANDYAEASTTYPDTINWFMLPAGQQEQQLGYTIVLENAQVWIDLCNTYLTDENNVDYESLLSSVDDSFKEQILWLEENAYQYGFVIRYPENKEDETNQWYQPFVLRYVGKKTAKQMFKDELCMEEVDFSEI